MTRTRAVAVRQEDIERARREIEASKKAPTPRKPRAPVQPDMPGCWREGYRPLPDTVGTPGQECYVTRDGFCLYTVLGPREEVEGVVRQRIWTKTVPAEKVFGRPWEKRSLPENAPATPAKATEQLIHKSLTKRGRPSAHIDTESAKVLRSEGMTESAIAARLGVSQPTVHRRLTSLEAA